MTFRDVMTMLESADRVRILQDKKVVYEGYCANMRANKEILSRFGDMEVKRYRLNPEIRHKQWKERKLMPPMRQDETPDYTFKDLQMTIYHDIFVEEAAVAVETV